MGRWVISALVASGCSFSGGSAVPGGDAGGSDAAPGIDAAADAAADAPSSGTLTFVDGPDYDATRDTYLSAAMPDQALGAGLQVRWEADVPEVGLVRFDGVFDDGAVPAGATITEAILAITVIDPSDENGDGQLVEVAIPWTEAVTFNDFGAEAGVQQGDRHPETIAALPVRLAGRQELDVTESLQRWSAGERDNHGWLLLSGNINDEVMHSRETATAGDRPTLMVSYTVP